MPGGISFPTGVSDSGSATITKACEIGETEVTYELWHTVWIWATTGGHGYTWTHAGYGGSIQEPVVSINWFDAVVWFNAATGLVAVYLASYPAVVKSKTANALGLYDMSGNVWEWCYDWSTLDVRRSIEFFLDILDFFFDKSPKPGNNN